MIAAHMDYVAGKWTKRLSLVLAGWIACSAYYGTLHLKKSEAKLQTVQAVDIPKLKKAINCEDARADKASSIAKQAIASQYVDSVPIPDAKAIPKDCPHPASVK